MSRSKQIILSEEHQHLHNPSPMHLLLKGAVPARTWDCRVNRRSLANK